jgi:hypothetical protein
MVDGAMDRDAATVGSLYRADEIGLGLHLETKVIETGSCAAPALNLDVSVESRPLDV